VPDAALADFLCKIFNLRAFSNVTRALDKLVPPAHEGAVIHLRSNSHLLQFLYLVVKTNRILKT
jgi:hypothetical protein